MLTDTEVADTARDLLSDELAGLTPPAGLLADVRGRHARAQRTRRAASTALATVAVAAVTAGIVTAAGSLAPRTPPNTSAGAAHSPAARTETIVMDGYAIRVRTGLQVTVRVDGRLTASFAAHPVRLALLLQGGPLPAGAVRVGSWQRPAYLLNDAGQFRLYLPFPVADRGYHSLVISGAGLSKAELLRIAAAITIDGQPGFLKSVPRPVTATHCPCG
ncbi:MAG TPA: hypothetical protein VMB74_14455 [Streptosporangiaceae bacterium]|nr:hypothetical protein [Streptosporangiaceae bacterium]